MRGLFMKTNLRVVFVTSNQPTPPRTLEQTQYEMACHQILQCHSVRRTAEFVLPSKLATPRTVHCECALISFIENNSSGPVFSRMFSFDKGLAYSGRARELQTTVYMPSVTLGCPNFHASLATYGSQLSMRQDTQNIIQRDATTSGGGCHALLSNTPVSIRHL